MLHGGPMITSTWSFTNNSTAIPIAKSSVHSGQYQMNLHYMFMVSPTTALAPISGHWRKWTKEALWWRLFGEKTTATFGWFSKISNRNQNKSDFEQNSKKGSLPVDVIKQMLSVDSFQGDCDRPSRCSVSKLGFQKWIIFGQHHTDLDQYLLRSHCVKQ